MKRTTLLLAVVAGLLIAVLFFVLVFQPQREEVAELEAQTAAQQAQQAQLEGELVRLRSVRESAPEAEAALAAAEAIVPRDPALPPALRQLQLAADESGATLLSVATGRPTDASTDAEAGASDGASTIDVAVSLEGGYFQIVDFLRRTEAPEITPRGFRWTTLDVGLNEYPDLSVSLSGRIFAVLEVPLPSVPEGDASPPPDDDGDADVEVEIEVEE